MDRCSRHERNVAIPRFDWWLFQREQCSEQFGGVIRELVQRRDLVHLPSFCIWQRRSILAAHSFNFPIDSVFYSHSGWHESNSGLYECEQRGYGYAEFDGLERCDVARGFSRERDGSTNAAGFRNDCWNGSQHLHRPLDHYGPGIARFPCSCNGYFESVCTSSATFTDTQFTNTGKCKRRQFRLHAHGKRNQFYFG